MMPNLTLNQRRAREKRVTGGAHFRSPSEEVIDLSDFIEESLKIGVVLISRIRTLSIQLMMIY